LKYTQRRLREGVLDDRSRRGLAAVLGRVCSHRDLHEQPHDLLALLVRQSRVEAPADFVEQCMGTLGDRGRPRCLQLAHAGFERDSLAADAFEFAFGLDFAQMAADRETQDPLALGPEACDRASERDALGLRDRRLALATELSLKVREHVARVAQEALDVCPDLPLDLGAAKEGARTGPAERSPVRLAATAAVPDRARPPLAPNIREATAPAPDDAL
jgi:hypothetical protein